MCQVWQVLLRDPEEMLTHLLMHGHAFSSSAALLIHSSGMHPSCSNWWAWDLGLWTCKTHVPSPCSAHTLPLEISYLSFLLIFPAVLTRVTIRQPLFSACISPALPRPPTQPLWEPEAAVFATGRPWRSSKPCYSLRIYTGFPDTWLPQAHKSLLFSPAFLPSKAKGI